MTQCATRGIAPPSATSHRQARVSASIRDATVPVPCQRRIPTPVVPITHSRGVAALVLRIKSLVDWLGGQNQQHHGPVVVGSPGESTLFLCYAVPRLEVCYPLADGAIGCPNSRRASAHLRMKRSSIWRMHWLWDWFEHVSIQEMCIIYILRQQVRPRVRCVWFQREGYVANHAEPRLALGDVHSPF